MNRPLTPAERAALSPGLADALDAAGVAPRIRDQTHPAAYVAALWIGGRPIMAVGRTVWWPKAAADFAALPVMAVLQHELQHLLDFGQGRLTIPGYLIWPGNWIYRYRAQGVLDWNRLGAEQRASLAEHLWRAQHKGDAATAERLSAAIPWAPKAG